MMTERYHTFQSFFLHTQIGFNISFFEDKYMFCIKIINIFGKRSILLGKQCFYSIYQFIIVTMCFPRVFKSTIVKFCLCIIISQIILRHKSIIYNIIPVTNKKSLQSKSCKKFTSKSISSFSINIYNFIVSKLIFSFRKGMKIFQIKFKKICICFSFYHNYFIDEENFR